MAMLRKGTKKRDALAIAAEAERLGARLSSDSGLDTSTVGLNAMTNKLEPSLALWTDVITNASFPPEEIERLRAQQIASIAQEQAQPVQLALRLLPPVIYGADHAYGVPLTGSGTVESTRSITRDDLIQFRETWLRPDNATVFVVGDTTLDAIKPMLEKAFRNWHAPSTAIPKKNVSTVAMPSAPRVILIDKPGAPQSLIIAGEVAPPSGAENNVAISAMNDVLGGQFTSRINMNLREAKHWSYGAQTLLLNARGQRPFIVYAPVQTDKTGDSLKELVAEVNGIITARPVTQKEMTPVIENSVRKLPGSFEQGGAVLSSLESSANYGRPFDYPATLAARYNALKLDDLNAAAKEVVHPSGLVWLIVGDRAKIEDQVKAANIAPIEFWTADGKPAT
jgi:zinc protease